MELLQPADYSTLPGATDVSQLPQTVDHDTRSEKIRIMLEQAKEKRESMFF